MTYISLIIGWLLDKLLGDPPKWPHPVVYFGKAIACGERLLNKGAHRRAKGGLMAVTLILATFALTWLLLRVPMLLGDNYRLWSTAIVVILQTILIFFCLAGTTLIKEVRMVFEALDRSIDEGRSQVARIVGRDTSQLDAQEIRKAALETLAENLSDGVIAPLFWLILIGVPGMMTYKMVNTLDSMIGYRTERYRHFGTVAARIDDVANYIPARLTALLMIVGYRLMTIMGLCKGENKEDHEKSTDECAEAEHEKSGINNSSTKKSEMKGRNVWELIRFVGRYGNQHASPNSGWPESALAGILDCQFGGTHIYFGETIKKPNIGTHDRPLTSADMTLACKVNQSAEAMMVVIACVCIVFF